MCSMLVYTIAFIHCIPPLPPLALSLSLCLSPLTLCIVWCKASSIPQLALPVLVKKTK